MRSSALQALLLVALSFDGRTALAVAPLSVSTSLSDTTVVVGDVVTLEVSVVSHVDGAIELSVPKMDGLNEISRSKSESTSIQWGGAGQMVTKEYTITIELEAERDGKVTIPAIKAKAGSAEAESRPLLLTIGGSQAPAPAEASAGQVAPPQRGEEQLFLRYRVDRGSAYVGEQILIDLEVYALPNLSFGIEEASPPPSPDGFWKEVVDQPQRLTRRVESVGGRSYHVYRVFRLALFPLEPGERTLPSAQITFAINRSIFGGGQRERRRTPAIKLEGLPLPSEGRPPSFSNQNVGEYKLTGTLDADKVPAGKALTLTLRVAGRGNIKNLRLPELKEIPGFRVFAPSVTDKPEISEQGIAGEKRADYLLMPERGGRLEVPPIELASFNPAEKRYERLTTASMRVVVEGDPAPSALAEAGGAVPESAPREQTAPKEAVAEATLRPIRFRSSLGPHPEAPWESPLYPALFAAPPLLYALYFGQERIRSRVAQSRRSNARRSARRDEARGRLRYARESARSGDATRAFRAAQESLIAIASERAEIELRGLTIEEARTALRERGASPAIIEGLARELELADYARFATAAMEKSALAEAAERWEILFEQIEAWAPASGEEGPTT